MSQTEIGEEIAGKRSFQTGNIRGKSRYINEEDEGESRSPIGARRTIAIRVSEKKEHAR